MDCLLAFHAGMRFWIPWPERCAFASFLRGDDGRGEQTAVMLEPALRISAAAVDLLDSQIRFQHRGLPEEPYEILLPMRFIPGKTLPWVRREELQHA